MITATTKMSGWYGNSIYGRVGRGSVSDRGRGISTTSPSRINKTVGDYLFLRGIKQARIRL